MDLSKAEGIISAIEAESKTPAPSHNNLARLVAMFCREVLSSLQDVAPVPTPSVSVQPSAPAEVAAAAAVEPPAPTPLVKGPRGRKSTKKVGK